MSFMRNKKDLPAIKRFVIPALVIGGSNFMIVAA